MANVNTNYYNLNWTSSWDGLPQPLTSCSLFGTASTARTGSYPAVVSAATLNRFPVWGKNTTLSATSSLINILGNIGINTTIATLTQLYVYNSNGATATATNVIGSRAYQGTSIAGTQVVYGSYTEAVGVGGSSGVTFGGKIIGSYVSSNLGGGNQATGSDVVGLDVNVTTEASTVCTGSVSVVALNLNNLQTGASSVYFTSNAALLVLEPVTGSANITNWYGLYQAGANDKNYFAANTGIGSLPVAGGNTLVVKNNISCSAITASFYRGYMAPNRQFATPAIVDNYITLSFLTPEMYMTFSEGKAYTITCSNTPTVGNFSDARVFCLNTSTVTSSLVWGAGMKNLSGGWPSSITSSKSFMITLTAYAGTVVGSFIPEA